MKNLFSKWCPSFLCTAVDFVYFRSTVCERIQKSHWITLNKEFTEIEKFVMMPHCCDIKFKLSNVSNIYVIASSESLTVFDFKVVAAHWCRLFICWLGMELSPKIQKRECLPTVRQWLLKIFWFLGELKKGFQSEIVWGLERWLWAFLSRFAKLQKALISCVMSVHLHDRFSWNLSIFRKSVRKICKSDKNCGCFAWRRMSIYDNTALNS